MEEKQNESQRKHRTITLSFRRRDRDSSKKISKTYRRTDRTCRCEKSNQTFLGESTMRDNFINGMIVRSVDKTIKGQLLNHDYDKNYASVYNWLTKTFVETQLSNLVETPL